MIKRKNKIIALLLAASSTLTLMPAMAADSTSRLGSKDGHITNAIAYKDGKYVYQGYKSDDDTDSIYYNGGDKDKEIDDISDATLNTPYEDKYAFANDGSDQYLVDLTNGSESDDTTPTDDIDTAATKLQTKLNKTDRYKKSADITVTSSDLENGQSVSDEDSTLFTIPGNKFSDSWYSYAVTPNSSDATNYTGSDGKLYGFTNSSGKYIDASYTANIYAYSTTEGKTVKIEHFSNNPDDKDSDSGLLATLLQQPVALTQDKDYIYALVTVAITDYGNNVNITGGTTTSALASVPNLQDNGSGVTTVRTYIQKISKAQGDQKDDAYLPKTVESYEVGNNLTNSYSNKHEYDCSDATDAYSAITDALSDAGHSVTNLTDLTQEDVVVRTDNGEIKPIFTISNGNLVVIDANSDNVKGVTLKFKKDKVKFTTFPGYKGTASTTTAPAGSFDSRDKVDIYMVEKDSDDSVDIDSDRDATAAESYDIDVNGNLWVVTDGKIYEYKAGGDMTKVYTCDSSFDAISVYDENSLFVWEINGDIYTTVNEGKSETTPPVTTPAKVGWDQLADGNWNFYDATGTKVLNNWVNVGGVWYFLDANGNMAVGWQYINGSWYYLNPISDGSKGAMKTGWVNDNGAWYYLKSSGAMSTGWVNDNGTWYYLNPYSNGSMGAMKTGWINDNGTWYYLYSNGAMAANTIIQGYRLSSSGAMI